VKFSDVFKNVNKKRIDKFCRFGNRFKFLRDKNEKKTLNFLIFSKFRSLNQILHAEKFKEKNNLQK
jgi:hypothetical protein